MSRRMIRSAALAAAALLATAGLLAVTACDPTEPDSSEYGFEVRAEPGQLVLANDGAAVVRYVAMEKRALMLSSFDFTSAVEDWPTIDPGGQVVILNEELTGHSAEATHASILWAIGLAYQATVEVSLR
jgi:hypothetical protein